MSYKQKEKENKLGGSKKKLLRDMQQRCERENNKLRGKGNKLEESNKQPLRDLKHR